MRNGQPDWYAVAEHLAPPQLLDDDLPASRPAHRPRGKWSWLVDDVNRVRQQKSCTVEKACQLLAKGEFPWRVVVTDPNTGERRLFGAQPWKRMKPKTLKRRYYEDVRRWRAFVESQPIKDFEWRKK